MINHTEQAEGSGGHLSLELGRNITQREGEHRGV